MKVYVNVKQIGKKKNKIDKKEYEINEEIKTVKELLTEFVTINVKNLMKVLLKTTLFRI